MRRVYSVDSDEYIIVIMLTYSLPHSSMSSTPENKFAHNMRLNASTDLIVDPSQARPKNNKKERKKWKQQQQQKKEK